MEGYLFNCGSTMVCRITSPTGSLGSIRMDKGSNVIGNSYILPIWDHGDKVATLLLLLGKETSKQKYFTTFSTQPKNRERCVF